MIIRIAGKKNYKSIKLSFHNQQISNLNNTLLLKAAKHIRYCKYYNH